jgi:ubiquinol-cytochrome c reductase core subunit 2
LGGGSLAWPGSLHPALDDVKQYAKAAFSKGNFAVLGTGIQQDALARLVEKSLGALYRSDSAAPTSAPSTYFGGETRVEAHGGPQTVFIGFGTTGTQQSAELAVLSAHLSPEPSVKWSSGSTSPITEVDLPTGTTVRTMLLPYSDATLFGLLIQGETAEGVREAGKIAVKALKDGGSGASVKEPALKKAVAKAKFTSASALDGREELLSALGAKACLPLTRNNLGN